ncbi:MAG: amidohydrolase family protein [Planctomycetota bacterium]
MIIDVHCHYALTRRAATVAERFSFEPAADAAESGTEGCAGAADRCGRGPAVDRPGRARLLPTDFDSCISPRVARRPSWRAGRWWRGCPPPGPELDARLEQDYAAHLFASGPIERYVLLAFDAVHDSEGRRPPLPEPGERGGSDLYVSNSFVRDLCRRHPQRFLFGASVHPYRADAVACVEEVFAGGAALLKWMPLHHDIDVADPRSVAVLRRCGELGLPVLLHYGEEYTLATHRPEYRDIGRLLAVLWTLRHDGRMPAVIIAHAATPVLDPRERRAHKLLLAALAGEFADAPLYADISALATILKIGYLRRLARRPELHAKLLFGSDFPVPPFLPRLRRDLGRDYAAVARVRSWPQRIALACRRMGFAEIVFHRAAELLPNVDFFAPRADKPALAAGAGAAANAAAGGA